MGLAEESDQLVQLRKRSETDFLGLALPLTRRNRHNRAGETELGRLFESLVNVAHGPHGPGQTDLTEIDGVVRSRVGAQGRHQRRGDGKIRGGLVEP